MVQSVSRRFPHPLSLLFFITIVRGKDYHSQFMKEKTEAQRNLTCLRHCAAKRQSQHLRTVHVTTKSIIFHSAKLLPLLYHPPPVSHSGSRLDWNTAVSLVLFVWLSSAFWAALPLLGWGHYDYEPLGTCCTLDYSRGDR